jgi:hypothetical protein
MSKVIDFKNKLKKKNNKKDKRQKFNEKKITHNFEFHYKANYDKRKLYINVQYAKYDINVDVGVNLGIIKSLIEKNPMTILSQDLLKEITNLGEQYVIAIHAVYKAFEFINPKTLQVRSLNDIAETYIEKRLNYGYPKDREQCKKIVALEKEVFSQYIDDTSQFNEGLYWKAKRKY